MKQLYTSEINPEMQGQEVVLYGWVHEIRDLGGVVFLIIRDREGIAQVTLAKKLADSSLFKKVRELTRESVVKVKGRVKEEAKAPRGFEILPMEVEILSNAASPLPLDPTEKVP
ncbi:MAG: OB-fold nucleic acid binding domain-containing protein, partial [Methanocellales archaeon]